jgi:inosine/xanthosine triphosphate pyrophosphatase family protein
LFEVPGTGQTVAELPADLKNQISHRGQALAALRELLQQRPGLLGSR